MENREYTFDEIFKNPEEIREIKNNGSLIITEDNDKFELKLIKKEDLSHEEELRIKTRKLLEKYDEAMIELAK